MKKIIFIVLVSAALFGVYFYMTGEKDFLYNGTVEAIETTLSSRIAGTVKQYNYEEGDIVKHGDILVEIDSKDIELAFDIAKKDFNRAQQLMKTSNITNEKYDLIKYKYEDMLTKLSWTKIISPSDGKIIYKFHEKGEFVSPGEKLITISDNSRVDVALYVEHDMLAKIYQGMDVKGYLPEMQNKEFNGNISFINDKSEFTPRNVLTKNERTRLVFRVKVKFENSENILKSGMTLEIKLPE